MKTSRSIVAAELALVLATASAGVSGCKSRAEPERTPAETAAALVNDVSPLDSASALPLGSQQVPWSRAFCDVSPEPDKRASFSELTVSGTCAFRHAGPATCRAHGDDYYAVLSRKLADGNDLELYVNVEYYTGPGSYDRKVEILALLRRGQSLYRWSNEHATVTLGFGEGGMSTSDKGAEQAQASTPTVVQLERTELAPEPGTATRESIVLEGLIGCLMRKVHIR